MLSGLSSCKEYKKIGCSQNGYYNLKISASESKTLYCDMTTDGGGWTLNFEGSSNYNTLSSQFKSQAVKNTASEVMIVYSNSLTNLTHLSTPYKFPKPSNFDLWTNTNIDVSTLITDLSTSETGTYTLTYGSFNFGSRACDSWTPGTYWGRLGICIPSTGSHTSFNDFPFYSGFADAGADFCSSSNQAYNATSCSQSKFLLIFFR